MKVGQDESSLLNQLRREDSAGNGQASLNKETEGPSAGSVADYEGSTTSRSYLHGFPGALHSASSSAAGRTIQSSEISEQIGQQRSNIDHFNRSNQPDRDQQHTNLRGMSAEPGIESLSACGRVVPVRRSPEGPRVQAVSPFGVRQDQIPLPNQSVVKQLYREVASGQLSTSLAPQLVSAPTQGQISTPPAYPGVSEQPSVAHPVRPPGASFQQQQGQQLHSMLQQYQSLVQQQQQRVHSGSQTDIYSAGHYAVSSPAVNVQQETSTERRANPNALIDPTGQSSNNQAVGVSSDRGVVGHQIRETRAYAEGGTIHPSYGSANVAGGSFERERTEDFGANVSSRMLGVLSEENKKLRLELEAYIKKTAKLQQVELHYQKIAREYEELVRRQEKREQLETQMRKKMEIETRRVMEENRILHDHIEQLTYQMQENHMEERDGARQELARLNMIIAQVMPQNKELMACKQRQEIELEARGKPLRSRGTIFRFWTPHWHIHRKKHSNWRKSVDPKLSMPSGLRSFSLS